MLTGSFSSSESYGRLFAYDKTYDRIITKAEKPLQLVDRIKYNTTTSDDPVMQEVGGLNETIIFGVNTNSLLACS